MKQISLTIYGRVQGVFFRAEARARALENGIKGWVKNNEDGSVSICAQGDEPALKKFIEWCKIGPPKAKVTDVQQKETTPDETLKDFRIIY